MAELEPKPIPIWLHFPSDNPGIDSGFLTITRYVGIPFRFSVEVKSKELWPLEIIFERDGATELHAALGKWLGKGK